MLHKLCTFYMCNVLNTFFLYIVGHPSPPNIKCPPHTDKKSTIPSCQGSSTSVRKGDVDVHKEKTEQHLVRPVTSLEVFESGVKEEPSKINVEDCNQSTILQSHIQGIQIIISQFN